MSLTIDSAETERLARELAALTGETVADAVKTALAERLQRHRCTVAARRAVLRGLRERVSALPLLDTRSDEELLGYDQDGLPG